MLDTVKLRSPCLTEGQARAVESCLQRRTCLDLSTGEVLYEFTSGPLAGTWDHRVSVQVERSEWRVFPGQRQPEHVKTAPYLMVEGSVHKAMLGHNVFGGTRDLAAAIRWFVDDLGEKMGVQLPPAALWRLRRVDWAHLFDLGSVEAVQEFIGYMHNTKYARRKVSRFEDEALMVAGTTTSVKLYHKGPEFQKHDRKRVRGHTEVDKLQAIANNLLRCEVEIHARTLDEEYPEPGAATVNTVTVEWIENLYDRDLGRLLREGASDMRIVRTATAVRRRLYETYTDAQASALWGTWLELSAMGEGSARARLPRRTFYDHRKKLRAAGCSWHNGDVKLDTRVRLVPEDFTPSRFDPRCCDQEAPRVAELLAPYRVAS